MKPGGRAGRGTATGCPPPPKPPDFVNGHPTVAPGPSVRQPKDDGKYPMPGPDWRRAFDAEIEKPTAEGKRPPHVLPDNDDPLLGEIVKLLATSHGILFEEIKRARAPLSHDEMAQIANMLARLVDHRITHRMYQFNRGGALAVGIGCVLLVAVGYLIHG